MYQGLLFRYVSWVCFKAARRSEVPSQQPAKYQKKGGIRGAAGHVGFFTLLKRIIKAI
jgi:hypothetical protein